MHGKGEDLIKGEDMKVLLEFHLPEDQSEYEDAMDGTRAKIALNELFNRLIRPYNKHGYAKENLQMLSEKLNKKPEFAEFMDALREEFVEVLEEYNLSLD